jgi:hypothetical protein
LYLLGDGEVPRLAPGSGHQVIVELHEVNHDDLVRMEHAMRLHWKGAA